MSPVNSTDTLYTHSCKWLLLVLSLSLNTYKERAMCTYTKHSFLKVVVFIGSLYLGGAFAVRPTSLLSNANNEKLSNVKLDAHSRLPMSNALGIRGGAGCACLGNIGNWYAAKLSSNPILTKSVTAALIFAASDASAQAIEAKGKDGEESKRDVMRTFVSGLVGLLYFGPAAHAWYDMIFKLLPGTGLISTIKKATLGQLIFGPSFTCVFFAISLLQSGTFSLGNFVSKVKRDLPGAWKAGLGFWPLVDLVSYSLIPQTYIPLFVNFCSFCWTIYLSMIANRTVAVTKEA